ncbi:hypothetical protein DFH06DRAFT_290824 [Mycena polygramma]|nr:hypothetical protein DFH06DRAFT_290824 [Mycena polygramma]
MFFMTLHKCGATIVSLGPGRTPVITLFLRDGVFWFLALVLVSVVEIVLWEKGRPSLAQIPVVPATALIAVIGARVILNIKYIASSTAVTSTTYDSHHISVRRAQGPGGQVPWYLRTTDTSWTVLDPHS